jgi:hypothetical protein
MGVALDKVGEGATYIGGLNIETRAWVTQEKYYKLTNKSFRPGGSIPTFDQNGSELKTLRRGRVHARTRIQPTSEASRQINQTLIPTSDILTRSG